MTLLIIIGFLLAVTGIFIILNLSPFTFLEELGKALKPTNTSMRSKIDGVKKQKKPKGLKLLVLEVKEILKMTGKESTFSTICVLSMMLSVFGVMVAITMNNTFLVPVLACGFAIMPFYYIKFTSSRRKKEINGDLETALSVITTSYMRDKNSIQQAIDENLEYFNSPIYEVFASFIARAEYIDSNVKEGLELMKLGIDNVVFHEWVDAVIACQDDNNLKSTLQPIVSKLSDVRLVSAELELILLEPVKEYITMILLVLGSIPIMYFLNREWYETLMFTDFGKILLAISGGVIFFSMGAVIKHTRPIEYKR